MELENKKVMGLSEKKATEKVAGFRIKKWVKIPVRKGRGMCAKRVKQ